jgi:hypothetical protein
VTSLVLSEANGIEAYLDSCCARLPINPAEAEEIREELRCHLRELVESYVAEGMDRQTAGESALAWFGDARRLHDSLGLVHHGDPWWVWRLNGMLLGALLGAMVALLLPVGGHIEFVGRACPRPPLSGMGIPALQALNGLIAGALIGLLSGRRGLFVGWVTGSLIWMGEYVAHFIISVATDMTPPDGGLHLFNSVILSPVLGGLFGAAVGGICTAVLTAASRLRPDIR